MNDISVPHENPDYRQMLVGQKGLKMRAGKLAAQAAHASLAALTRGPGAQIRTDSQGVHLVVPLDDDLHAWLTGVFKKICVYVNSEEELLELHRKALEAGMRCSLIQDSGLTEFGGVPTYTVLAIGPHPKARLDPLTGQLPLY
jgi:PTH2 family peptidyl-tRNA hydrolase